VIEPLMKPQWWVNCTPLAQEAIARTRAGELLITPKASENEWFRWLEGMHDWCISRQLWWGHRCPAYFVRVAGIEQDVRAAAAGGENGADAVQANDGKWWVVGRSREQAEERAKLLADGREFTLEQDEDVLDTWFSSGLWPFSILGWPEKVRSRATARPQI
jgi:valyl-tRNA synthetase